MKGAGRTVESMVVEVQCALMTLVLLWPNPPCEMGLANPTSRVIISDYATVDIGRQNETPGCTGFVRWPTVHKIEIQLRPVFPGHKTDKVRYTRLLWANSPRDILRIACACFRRGFTWEDDTFGAF